MSIVQIVSQILVRITDAIGIVQRVLSTLITSGWYIVVQDAAAVTGDIHGLLDDPTCGQEAQCDKLNSIITTTDDIVTLLNDLSTLVGAARVVNLPATPPAGYGGATAAAAAAAVWSFIPVGFGQTMGYFQENAGLFAVNLSTSNLRVGLADQMRWSVYGSWVNSNGPDLPDRDVPSLDPATILPTDSDIAAWINRVQPGYLAYLTPENWATIDGSNGFNYLYDLSPWEFETIRANNTPATWGASGAPVWPGIANVTLGTPVAFSGSALSVAGPMDGVIVTITAVNQPLPHYAYGTAIAWGRLGGLTFVDDNGDAEEYQLFGFVDAIYCPKAMVQAASCQIRNVSGIVGTVTPWTKS